MDVVLERKQTNKIIFFRLVFLVMILLITMLVRYQLNDYAVVTAVVLVAFFIPSVVELQVFSDHLHIQKYFCLAMIKKSYTVNHHSNLLLRAFDMVIDPGNDPDNPSFPFSAETIVKYYKFNYIEGEKEKKIAIRLTAEEYTYISVFEKKQSFKDPLHS